MNRTSFIAACALMVLALTLVARMVLREAENPAGKEAAKPDSGAKALPAGERQAPAFRSMANRGKSIGAPQSEGFTVRSGQPASHGGNGGASSPDERASSVESHARAKLDELDRHLHLTSAQKRNVFPLLARDSPGYDPSMVIGGPAARNVGAVPYSAPPDDQPRDITAAIIRELDPNQQAMYEDMLIDDGLWWAEIIAKIDTDFEQTNRNASPPDTTGDDDGAGENLFDLLDR